LVRQTIRRGRPQKAARDIVLVLQRDNVPAGAGEAVVVVAADIVGISRARVFRAQPARGLRTTLGEGRRGGALFLINK